MATYYVNGIRQVYTAKEIEARIEGSSEEILEHIKKYV